MKYFITGGAGFIGSAIAKRLISEGHEVTVYDAHLRFHNKYRAFDGVRYIEGDIREGKTVAAAMEGSDGVFHCAAILSVPHSFEHPMETHDVNVTGTLNCLLAAKQVGAKRFVFCSSSAVYGETKEGTKAKEDAPLRPMSMYGFHKKTCEEYGRLFSELYGLDTVNLRYYNVYGAGMNLTGPYATVIGKFIAQKKEGTPLTICGDGEYKRDFVHVSDVVEANMLAMNSKTNFGGDVFNIATGKTVTVNQIAKLVGGKTQRIDERPGDVRYSCGDITKAEKTLGFKPKIKFEDGIKELLKP